MLAVIAESEIGQRKHRNILQRLLKNTEGMVRVASAYVTDTHLLSGIKKRDVRLLTYLSKMDIVVGASSLNSLATLIKAGVHCRYLSSGPRLHAKVYVFDGHFAVVTSANLTYKALDNNIEVGVHLSSTAAKDLARWFDTLWEHSAADTLDLATVSRWRRETETQRAEYSALRKRVGQQPKLSIRERLSIRSEKNLRDLFKRAGRFFVCNTNRKDGEEDEERMHDRGYAAAWEDFRYPTHMDKVRQGDAIFMFAKGKGIIGIGRAKARPEVLKPDNPLRITKGATPERRVPVDWLAWEKDRYAFPCKSPNSTFFDISKDKYTALREKVKRHFLSEKS